MSRMTTDAWLEEHVIAVSKNFPAREHEINAMIDFAHEEHRMTAAAENLGIDDVACLFELRDVSGPKAA